MIIKQIYIGLLVMLVLSLGWRYRHSEFMQGLLNPTPAHQPNIQFDNGTVRELRSGPSASQATQTNSLKKCLHPDGSTSYAQGHCPAGTREQVMTGGTFNVAR